MTLDLDKLRMAIDGIDAKIVELLKQRAEIAALVGEYKKERDLPFHVVAREREIFDRIAGMDSAPFPKEALRTVFREILSACLALEEPITISYMGPPATYTHQAALKHFGHSLRHVAAPTVREVFRAVESGEALYGVVPIENSTEGMVNNTLDTLIESDLMICAEIVLPIHHCLLTRADSATEIRIVYAHPQALAQCRMYLANTLPHAAAGETTSNTKAVEMALEDPHAAAIAGEMAAEVYNIPIFARQVEDYPNNQTRFLVIGTIEPGKTRKDQTSIMVSIIDRVGALSEILSLIAAQGVNLTRLESRPSRKKAWDYIFFMDIEGHQADRNIRELLGKLQTTTPYVRILGSYPLPESFS